MTIPYNTTHLQGIKYLRENFEFDLDENLKYNNLENVLIDDIDEKEVDLDNCEEQFNIKRFAGRGSSKSKKNNLQE